MLIWINYVVIPDVSIYLDLDNWEWSILFTGGLLSPAQNLFFCFARFEILIRDSQPKLIFYFISLLNHCFLFFIVIIFLDFFFFFFFFFPFFLSL